MRQVEIRIGCWRIRCGQVMKKRIMMSMNQRMDRRPYWVLALVTTSFTSVALDVQETIVKERADIEYMNVSARDLVSPEYIANVPEHYTVVTHARNADGSVANTAMGPTKLIYSNTLGQRILPFQLANRRFGDDVATDSIAGCNLSRYVVRVNGGVPGGTSQFSCTTALFTACPSPSGGGILIPGTSMTFNGLADDITQMHDLVVDVSASPIPIPVTMWVRVECDLGSAGWVGGVPAELGFTQDRFFHPLAGCDSYLSPSFHAGFYVQVYADDPPAMPCDTQFVAYASTSSNLPSINCGAGQACADDFNTILAPTGESCILSAYEVGMRGASGAFSMLLDLRFPFTDFPIPGTEFAFVGKGDNRLELARYIIDPALDIIVPATALWVSWKADKGNTGLINARFPAAGYSLDEFYARFLLPPPPFWVPQLVSPRAAVYLVLYCRGETPRGACCRNQLAGDNQPMQCTDDLPITGCLGPRRWLKDTTCAENLFQPPCGEHACCTPGGCQDATYTECTTFQDPTSLGIPCTNNSHCPGRVCQPDGFCSPRSGVWQIGACCDPDLPMGIPVECAFYQCYFGSGDCFDAEEEIFCQSAAQCPLGTKCQPAFQTCSGRSGCNNISCCDTVCSADTFCCLVAWDSACVNRAQNWCEVASDNDICADDNSPTIGAKEILITPLAGGFEGFTEANNTFAIAHPSDPFACCNKGGADAPVAGTLWYKFVMPAVNPPGIQPTTARIHTCGTSPSSTAIDSVLAVFAVGDVSSEATACGTLDIIACNDDRDLCGAGQQADICVGNLTAGATYYIMLGSSNAAFQGPYNLEVEIPCTRALPVNNTCTNSQLLPIGSSVALDFNLLNATIDCPGEGCVNALKNDVWFDYIATCLGKATLQTCGPTANDDDPATSLVVYRVTNLQDTCDVDTADVVGCNENALVNTAEHNRRSQTCEFSGIECDTSASCQFRCSVSGDPCMTVADCHFCELQLGRSCNTNVDCLTCFFNDSIGNPISCTVASQTPTAECPGFSNHCRFTSANSCIKPNDNPPNFEEVCVKEPCHSSCGDAASVTIPVTPGALFKVRLGGDFGAEPEGVLSSMCTPQDCNNNNQPDLKEIQIGTAGDCNENEEIDACEITIHPSRDCNSNGLIDVCEIDRDSLAPGGPFFCISNCALDINNNGIPDECEPACPVATPIRCTDGTCVATVGDCSNSCVPPTPVTCPNGTCVASAGDCTPGCTSGNVLCASGVCVTTANECAPGCPASMPVRCTDGMCKATVGECPNTCVPPTPVTCPNGTCVAQVSDCSSICTGVGFLCANGVCVATPDDCFPICPGSMPVRCPNDTCVASLENCLNPPISPPSPHNWLKNRYLSFVPNNVPPVAFRVDKLTSPSGSCWVAVPDALGNAKCVASPVFRTWTEAVVHVGDCEIIPVADYAVVATIDDIVFSSALPVRTILIPNLNGKQWGDVAGVNNGTAWTPPNQFTNINDVLAVLSYITSATVKPTFQQTNLQAVSSIDPCLNSFVNTADVLILVKAVAGDAYPLTTNPASCPVCP